MIIYVDRNIIDGQEDWVKRKTQERKSCFLIRRVWTIYQTYKKITKLIGQKRLSSKKLNMQCTCCFFSFSIFTFFGTFQLQVILHYTEHLTVIIRKKSIMAARISIRIHSLEFSILFCVATSSYQQCRLSLVCLLWRNLHQYFNTTTTFLLTLWPLFFKACLSLLRLDVWLISVLPRLHLTFSSSGSFIKLTMICTTQRMGTSITSRRTLECQCLN